MTQGCFVQAVPGQLLLQAQTLCGTPGSVFLLWSPARSELWHSWVCNLILQGRNWGVSVALAFPSKWNGMLLLSGPQF